MLDDDALDLPLKMQFHCFMETRPLNLYAHANEQGAGPPFILFTLKVSINNPSIP